MVENISDHMARFCECGCVRFNLLRSGAIECDKCHMKQPNLSWRNEMNAEQINKEELINKMADRFCGWPLPKDFGPDCGISFDGRKDDEWNKNKSWPSGTNLLTHAQAKDMIRYMLDGAL